MNFSYISGLSLKENVNQSLLQVGIDNSDLGASMCRYMLASKSENTVKKYYYSFKKWQEFCSNKRYKCLPAEHIHVAIYLTELLDLNCSVHTISSAIYSIKWAHDINGLSDPTNNAFVKNLHESAKRLRGRKSVKKDIVSVELLIELCDNHIGSMDLVTVRDLCMITLGFAGFFRYDELSSIRCSDIKLHSDYFCIQIPKSKVDQYRCGSEVVISKGISSACPYSMLIRYMDLAGLDTKSEGYLFRPLFRSGSVCKPISKDKKLSYTRARQCLLDRLRSVAPDLNLGLHSLRASGCTKAANEDVNERCLKRHGRWKRDESRDGYIADSLAKKLEITKKLGL